MNPLCKWSGGKRKEIPLFKDFYPKEFNTFIEPFVGGGAVYFDLNFEGQNVINDIHPELVNFYRVIASGRAQEIYDVVSTWGIDETSYYKYRGTGAKGTFKPQTDVELAARFIYLRKTAFRGMMRYNKKGEFNIPYGKYKNVKFNELLDPNYQNLLSRTEVNLGSYKEIFERYNSPDNFVFLDPPYDSEFNDYGFDDFNRQSQIELAEIFKTTENKCMIVLGGSPFIRELYEGYIVHEYPKNYAFKIYGGRVGEEINVNHLVICNYEQ